MKKPCPIPRDLKPGDILHLRNGVTREVERAYIFSGRVDFYDMKGSAPPFTYYPAYHGKHRSGDKAYDVVRIERITSKPTEVKKDKDSAWLRWLIDRNPAIMGPYQIRRLRRIAKRLERRETK